MPNLIYTLSYFTFSYLSRVPNLKTKFTPFALLSVQIISIIVKNDEGWLAGQHSLVSQLRRVWVSEAFQERHRKDNMAATYWKEPKLLSYCLLSYCKYVLGLRPLDVRQILVFIYI